MGKYILKRTLMIFPTLLIILTIVFALMRMVPGSPVWALLAEEENVTPERVEEVETEMGFNDPIPVQYWRYIKGIATGDWGVSYFNLKPVFGNMVAVWEPTIIIAIYATVITVSIALPVGIFSATHRNSLADYTISTLSTVTMVIPGFCMGLMMCYLFGYKMGWFPVVGYATMARMPEGSTFMQFLTSSDKGGLIFHLTKFTKGSFLYSLWNLTLPAFSLGIHHVASLARYTRSSMLDVLNQDYIRTARAKGLSRSKVYYKHAMKNTLAIVGTMIASSIAGMLGGASVTEKVFNIRGMGTLAVDSLGRRDYSQEQAIVIFFAMVSLLVDLTMDIFYKILDPRIEYE